MAIMNSYPESNYSSDTVLSFYTGIGQCFESTGGVIASAKFYIKRTAGTSGTMNAKIYAMTGTLGTNGKPTGSALATSDSLNSADISTSYALVEFTFSGAEQITLTDGTNYVITLEEGTATNVTVGIDNTSPTHEGNMSLYYSPNWGTNSSDMIFYVYSDLLVYTLDAEVGSFALTGIDNIFTSSRTIICETGSYILNGIDVAFTRGYTLVAGTGSFILTGIDVAFTKGYTLVAGTGSFILTGIAVTFTLIRKGLLVPTSYIKKVILNSKVSSVKINSKVVKKYIISKFK